MRTLADLTLLVVLLAAAHEDLRTRRIPNRLTAAGAFAATAFTLAGALRATPPEQIAATLATAGPLLAIALAKPHALGMGDVKLTAVMALFLGPAIIMALLAGLTAATVTGVAARARTLPLAPFLALGGAVALVAQHGGPGAI